MRNKTGKYQEVQDLTAHLLENYHIWKKRKTVVIGGETI